MRHKESSEVWEHVGREREDAMHHDVVEDHVEDDALDDDNLNDLLA